MPFMEWNSSYSVGVPELDEDHKKLVVLMNDLHDAEEAGRGHELLEKTLEEVIAYVFYHFRHEESYFLRFQYPEREMHQKKHEILAARAIELQDNFKTGASGDIAGANAVLDYLKDKVFNHIMVDDKKFGLFMHTIHRMP